MSTPSHVAAGIILTKYLISRGLLPADLQTQLYLTSALTANLPDLDAILFGQIYTHRDNSPFHYPFTWWLIFTTCFLIALLEARWLLPYVYLALGNVFLHFLMDTFGVNSGICWFAPFSKKEYSFLSLKMEDPNKLTYGRWLVEYLHHPIMILEISLTLAGLWAILT